MDTTLAERVCKTLEGITMLEMNEDPFHSMVYRFCHIARGTCKNPHEDWVKEFEQVEAEVNEACASPTERRKKHEDSQRIREQQ
jgi:hypothetical protein